MGPVTKQTTTRSTRNANWRILNGQKTPRPYFSFWEKSWIKVVGIAKASWMKRGTTRSYTVRIDISLPCCHRTAPDWFWVRWSKALSLSLQSKSTVSCLQSEWLIMVTVVITLLKCFANFIWTPVSVNELLLQMCEVLWNGHILRYDIIFQKKKTLTSYSNSTEWTISSFLEKALKLSNYFTKWRSGKYRILILIKI